MGCFRLWMHSAFASISSPVGNPARYLCSVRWLSPLLVLIGTVQALIRVTLLLLTSCNTVVLYDYYLIRYR